MKLKEYTEKLEIMKKNQKELKSTLLQLTNKPKDTNLSNALIMNDLRKDQRYSVYVLLERYVELCKDIEELESLDVTVNNENTKVNSIIGGPKYA